MTATVLSKSVVIKLDRERTITYNRRAEYMMSTLDRPFTIYDFRKPRRSGGALIAWVWACMTDHDRLEFRTPEDVAEVLLGLPEPEIKEIYRLFGESYAATIPPEPESPKAISSTTSPSPSSSSV